MLRPLHALLLSAALAGTTTPALAERQSFRADYAVTLLGLPVASARFDSTFTGDRFSIEGRLRTSGLARIFDRTDGTTKVEGSINGNGVQPRSYQVDYVSGRKKGRTSIRFSGDGVASAVNTPEPRRGKNWVPVSADQLRSVLDPISSTLIRASDPAEVCNRTIRAFDGEMRADLRLSHRGTGRVSGFEGPAVTCDARFVPVAGYREGRRQIEYMKNESRITISFAQLGDTGFYTPVDTSIGTQSGTLRITARSIRPR